MKIVLLHPKAMYTQGFELVVTQLVVTKIEERSAG